MLQTSLHSLTGKRFPQALAASLILLLAAGPVIQLAGAAPPAKTGAGSPQQAYSLVDKANAFAEQEKFGEAIPLYEQALRQLPASDPNFKQLQRNLQVLYVNQAVNLTQAKQYDQAEALLNKALANDPANSHARQSKAAIHFHRAMDRRDAGQEDPARRDDKQVEALLKQAMALDDKDANIKRALAANQFDQALALTETDQFEAAATYMEAALALDPKSQNIKASLVNIYLSLIPQDGERKQHWADKALALDPSDKTRLQVDQLLNPPVTQVMANDPESGKKALPASAAKLSVPDMMLDIENQWGLERDTKLKLNERVERAEIEINGKKGDGPLAKRVRDLYAQLYGAQAVAAADPTLQQNPLDEFALQNTYIGEIFKMTDGKVIRWGKFPLRVYIEEPSEKENAETLDKLYQGDYKQAVIDALDLWKEASNGSLSYVVVKNELAADVVFYWGKQYLDKFADADAVPDRYKNYSAPKFNNKLMYALNLASMFTPGIFSLAPMLVGSGLQYQQLKKMEVIRKESEITLGLDPVRDLPPEEAHTLVQNIAAKEFGHALGLKALSPDPGDLLYPELRSDEVKKPSKRDIQTLQQLYSRPANIILNVH